MSILSKPVKQVKPSKPANSSRKPLDTDEGERLVYLRDAIALVRDAKMVAVAVHVNDRHQQIVMNVSKVRLLASLRRLKGRIDTINVSDLFGTLVVGAV